MNTQAVLTLSNITWLLAAMAFVIAPHAARMPLWVSAVCLGAGAARWWIARHAWRTPPWWVMALIAIGIAAGARLEYGRLLGREVGVTLLIAMLCLKVLEMRTRRDAVLAIFLGFFLAMTNFFYSQTLLMGVYMLGCVWLYVATLIGFNRIGSEPSLRERVAPAFWLLVQAIPLMLVLFFLFPRLSGPLWRMPSEDSAATGLSDEMTPGDISKLSQSEAVVFRVDFDGPVPQNEDLYWRGPVLGLHFGRSWRAAFVDPRAASANLDYQPQSPPVHYRVTLQPHNKPWLFALDMPVRAPDDAFFTPDFQMRSRTLVGSLRSYPMASHLRFKAGSVLTSAERRQNLQLAQGFNPRARRYAEQLLAEDPDPKVIIEKLMARYNREFDYTVEPPKLGVNAVDEFLFDTKKGFCEHYAGSFVFLMRAAGIPARVVTGYQGGEVNPITRQLVVRQAEAHAWAEVWLEGLGWLRADPTFAVSPLRINRGMTAALGPIGVLNTLMEADGLGVLKQIAFSWDALNNQWNQWVIGFNADRQRLAMDMFFGVKEADWRDIAKHLLLGVFLVGGTAGTLVLLRAYRRRQPPLIRSWNALCEKLAKAGLPRAPHEAPLDYLARIEAARPDLAFRLRPLVDAYVALRYAPQDQQPVDVTAFGAMVGEFRAGRAA
ncbi:MAG TPA: DUF3488 and transglutaminase-like domain-containing protein [Usitatibacteraceae bacterium]|nr:DUF3488 and transglutaminase-like domain-containing protein [Usitatibacteraceae bacterium]